MSERQIFVFQLNDCEWWAGHDLESVKKAYLELTGVPEDEAFDEPFALDDKAINKLMYHFTNDEPDRAPVTFAQQLEQLIAEGEQFPCPFASTEF